MYRYLSILLLFATPILSAEKSTPYLTSECDTLALIEGVVNVYNGKLVQIDRDIEIQGSDPLVLDRFYDGGHHFPCKYGYGFGISFPTYLTFNPSWKKNNVFVEQRMGLDIICTVKRQKDKSYTGKVDSDYYKNGYSNCSEALLRGEPAIYSTKLEGDKDTFVVTFGDGTRRHYQYYSTWDGLWEYRLTLEERSNGNRRHFAYNGPKSIQLTRVWTSNKDDTLTLNWIEFKDDGSDVIITASNGQSVRYQLEQKKGKAVKKNLKKRAKHMRKTRLLTQVSGSHFPSCEYENLERTKFVNTLFSVEKVKKPSGRYLEAHYGRHERINRLHASGIDVPLYTITVEKTHTDVINALGAKTRYKFSKRRLTKLVEDHRTQEYTWDVKGQLTCHQVNDPSGNLISKRNYEYDKQGNIVHVSLVGNITQKNSQDTFDVRYTYSQDGFNLLLTENHNNEREFIYIYCPGTNLLASKMTFADQMVVERKFYDYDNNGIMIRKIVDDGTTPNRNDLTNVTYRRVTEIEPQLDPKLPGLTLPRILRECYDDTKTGQRHPLKTLERTYTQAGDLAQEKVYDANNTYRYSLRYEYDHHQQLIRQVDALGIETLFQYDVNGNKIYEEIIGSGKKVHYTYDAANRLVSEVEDTDKVLTTTYTYDPMGNRTSTTDPFGQKTLFQYDTLSREIATNDPIGQAEHKEYDSQGTITTYTDKDGYTTKTINNLYGDPLEIQYPDGSIEHFTYNLQGHLVTKTNRDQTKETYEVDYQGRTTLAQTFAPNGTHLKTLNKQYKGPNLIAEIDAMGNETRYLYDGAGRLTKKIQGDQTTIYAYDSLGRLSKTQIENTIEIAAYDNIDRVIEERTEDPAGNIFRKVQYTYDINGNRITQRDFTDVNHFPETTTLYNPRNQPIAEIDAEGNKTSITYHYSDHLEKTTTDPLGRYILEKYGPLQRLLAVYIYSSSGELLSLSSFTYDGRDNQILRHHKSLFQSQHLGIYAISTTYDAMGQKTSENEQNEKTTSYIYTHGRLETMTKPDGVILHHTYDPLGRLQELVSSDGTIHYRYNYDLNDNLLTAEDLVHQTITHRSYDIFNRLTYEKQATGLELSYSYDHQGRLTEMIHDNTKISYTYSPTSLISASYAQYIYTQQTNWQSKVVSATLPNQTNITYSWDATGRCTKIASSSFQQMLVYDSVGNLISTIVQDPIGSYTTTYDYDDLHQLTRETGPFANQYEYDSLNNRRQQNQATYAINHLNQLTTDSTHIYTYDPNGNRIRKNSVHYKYDALGRLIQAGKVTYTYDPFGRRVERRNAQTTVQYLYQFDTEIGAIENGVITEFRALYNTFAPFVIEKNNQVYHPIRNHRGDICILLDDQQTAQASYRFNAFGEYVHQGTATSSWLFSGQRYDRTTKLYHFAKRDYDPFTGQWLTPDPLGFADGPNLYAYVHNNPLVYVDPYGLWRQPPHQRNQQGGFTRSFTRGFIDDTSFGASNLVLGEHHCQSRTTKIGYAAGTVVSIGVGVLTGSTVLKGFRYGGKAAAYAYRGAKTLKAAKAASRALKAKNVSKIATESKPIVKEITQVVRKSGLSFAKNESHSITSLRRLNKKLASLEQMGEKGNIIAGSDWKGVFRRAENIAQRHGGKPSDWVKKSSSSYRSSEGARFETHWIENIKTHERIEYKTKLMN